MDMQQIGYFLFMEEEEKKQQEEQEKLNAELENDLVGELPTLNYKKQN